MLMRHNQTTLNEITRNLETFEARHNDSTSYKCVAELYVVSDRFERLLQAFDIFLFSHRNQNKQQILEHLTGIYTMLLEHGKSATRLLKRTCSRKASKGIYLLDEVMGCLQALMTNELERLERELSQYEKVLTAGRLSRRHLFSNI